MTVFGQARFRSTTGDGRHWQPLRDRAWRSAPTVGYLRHAERILRSEPKHPTPTRSPATTATTENHRNQTHPTSARADTTAGTAHDRLTC